MAAAQPARSVAADLAAWVLDAGRAVGAPDLCGGAVRSSPLYQLDEERCDDDAETVPSFWPGARRRRRAYAHG